MPEIVVDASLQPDTQQMERLHAAQAALRARSKADIVKSTIPEVADARFNGYFGYLGWAYNTHQGIVVSPTLIWYSVLAEIAVHVKGNAEHYRHLFTNSPERKNITVQGSAELGIDPRDFVVQLRASVPMDVNLFFPEFSTATEGYHIAASAAFCDAVSPYYNYMMYACGISRVKVEGTVQDWDNLLASLAALGELFDKAAPWAQRIAPYIAKMRAAADGEVDVDFWRRIYSEDRCGSGSQVLVNGWFKSFAMERPSPAFPRNFPTHISAVRVTQVETGKVYKFSTGLFHASIEGDYLVPQFGYCIERAG